MKGFRFRPSITIARPIGHSRNGVGKTAGPHLTLWLASTGFNAKEDRRHDRRTLGVDELRDG